ncbi:hypothetical protein ASZ78_013931 [Callipepla squamata]|uniref:Uncharacterized protein n=1 Tax=Callipepla squamata TaxID=9009 RepID=A0A226N4H1_CALSU|nr:hypothetical protein ASZ78_013931 [Callipepla squamata]
MRRAGEPSRAGRREPVPVAPRGGRTVLGVLVENGQQRPAAQVSAAEQLPAVGPRWAGSGLGSDGRKVRLGEAFASRLLSDLAALLCTLFQNIAATRCLSGSENTFPPIGKDEISNCVVNATSKQDFTIYIDETDEKENYNCQENEELETSLYELDTSAMTSSIHLLLDLSTGSPMLVDTSFRSRPEDQMGDPITLMTVGEYAEDIHQYLREAEVKYRPKPYYMRKQPDITTEMRAILVDWLVEVGEEYKLQTETLYLAVNYLDRFLSCMSVLRGKLQLVGTAAILLAAKYEEIYPPEVDEFVYITDDTYTKRQLLRMEHLLLKVLAFDLTIDFKDVIEICVSVDYLGFDRSIIFLFLLDHAERSPETLAAFTGYSLSEIVPCLTDLHKTCLDAPRCQLQAIKEKYKQSKYMQVSLLEPPAVLPLH